ncbi:hypothetical protein [Dialister succinatiphilus]|uniref:Uncharacterized protein n=1 Tax=Dialister succinatiphilus YIT 11850 TaxID=742743 RepID=H1CYZ3_9FIRM|nr:hypothetical protein [Dialister succinatiphilus]EHO63564.1 hypothetical protein HMPREF9453_00581 [Dialister succinatiphilus YIT 11850]
MAIKIEITGENAKDVMAEMFNLCSGVFAAYQNPPSVDEVKTAGMAMAQEPSHASAPKEEPKPENVKSPETPKTGVEDNPFMGYAKDVVQCVSEEQHNELKGICGQFVAAKPTNRGKLRAWLTEHKVKRLSELPENLYEDFKKWLEANKNAG